MEIENKNQLNEDLEVIAEEIEEVEEVEQEEKTHPAPSSKDTLKKQLEERNDLGAEFEQVTKTTSDDITDEANTSNSTNWLLYTGGALLLVVGATLFLNRKPQPKPVYEDVGQTTKTVEKPMQWGTTKDFTN